MGWACGIGSKHGMSAQVESESRWEIPTMTPAAGETPRGYTSRSKSSSGSRRSRSVEEVLVSAGEEGYHT